MAAAETTAIDRDNSAINWAKANFSFDRQELVRDRPWARTYRLNGGKAIAYLKVLSDRQAGIVNPTALLAKAFSRHVPTVIAHEDNYGWLLSNDHGGRPLSYDSSEHDLCKLLKTYARFQAEVERQPELVDQLPRLDLAVLLDELLAFLGSGSDSKRDFAKPPGAAYFVGRSEAKRYFRTLTYRRDILQQHLELASPLPMTLNHGELKPSNAAIAEDGALVLYDWDDAIAGPAGLSLHMMFSGCFKPTVLLTESSLLSRAVAGEHLEQRLNDYIGVLSSSGYADEATLRRSLPASICAGMMHFLATLGNFPPESRRDKNAIQKTIARRMTDLLDLCDYLASRTRETAIKFARDYAASGQNRRAQHVLQDYLADHPDDAGINVRLARVLRRRGRADEALAAYHYALKLEPGNAPLHSELGAMHLEALDMKRAAVQFEKAIKIAPNNDEAHEKLDRVAAFDLMRRHARRSDKVPTLTIAPKERNREELWSEKFSLAVSMFERHGVLRIDNAFPVGMIDRLRDAFFERYPSDFRDNDQGDAIKIGDRCYRLTTDLEEPFDDPDLLASPLMLPVLRELLGSRCVIGAFTPVVSLPGSKYQALHKDHAALFESTKPHQRLPSFGVKMTVPLVSLDDGVGTARVVKGSHRVSGRQAETMTAQDPALPLGSCLLSDYRLSHRGLRNRSDEMHPVLTIVYQRPWFLDFANFPKHRPFAVDDDRIDQMPKDAQRLFSWRREETSH